MDDDSDISFEDLDEGTPPKRPGVQTPPVPKGRPKRSVGQRETRSTRPTGSSRPTTEYHDLEGTAYQRKVQAPFSSWYQYLELAFSEFRTMPAVITSK